MPSYTVKVLLDFDAADDLEARKLATEHVKNMTSVLQIARQIVLQSPTDRKSIKMNRDGTYHDKWNRIGSSN